MAGSKQVREMIMFYEMEMVAPSSKEDEVYLNGHFGWEGLTHDDDFADLSTNEINEQGLNVTLRINK
tara:strand:- start:76 stop:276 length:201 start_codon:yes stop_codon:yes gene_type:complete